MTGRVFYSILGHEVQEEGIEEAAGRGHAHTNNFTKHCVSICDAWLVGFFSPGTYWGEPGNVAVAKRQEKKVHPFGLRRKQAVLRMEGADGAVQRLAWSEQAEKLDSFQRKRRLIRVVDNSFVIFLP